MFVVPYDHRHTASRFLRPSQSALANHPSQAMDSGSFFELVENAHKRTPPIHPDWDCRQPTHPSRAVVESGEITFSLASAHP